MVRKKRDPGENLIPLKNFLKYRHQTTMSLWASTGVGKSRFLITAPPPVFIYSFEPDGPVWALKNALTQGVIEEGDVFIDEVLLSVFGDEIPLARTVEEEAEILEYTQEALEYVIKNEKEGTIGIDTGTTLWQMVDEVEGEAIREKRAKQGKDLYRFDYRYAYKAFRRMIEAIKVSRLNCIITHHDQPVFNAKGEATQKKKYSGNNKLPELVEVHFRLQYSPNEYDEVDENGDYGRRWATIDKCRLDGRLVGIEIENPTFDKVLKKLTPK